MENYFITPFTLAALVPLITEFLKVNLKLKDWVIFKVFKKKIYLTQIISIVVSIILAVVGMWLNLGFLADTSIALTLLWGLLIGFASTGLFEAGYLEIIYSIIKKIKTK